MRALLGMAAGGTIQREPGVGQVFCALTVSGSGFLDFGSGYIGRLRFGNYTPTSLLAVPNFLPGNELKCANAIFSTDVNNALLFTFSNGFTTGTESGFFTITAIQEPST